MKSLVRAAVLAAILVFGMGAGSAIAQEAVATVTVIHAVPAEDGFPADVYLNGDLIIDGFIFEAASELFTIPAGAAELEIFAEGADPDTEDPAVSDTVTFEAGSDYSVVAQIVDEAPVLSVFVNDTTQVAAGQSRLTVRQASLLADLDVVLDGNDLFGALMQATDATADVTAGAHEVSFLASGEVLEERSLQLDEGALLVLYAVGSPDNDSFGLLAQRVVAQTTAPGGVPTGSGGHKAEQAWMPLYLGVSALVLLVAGLRIRGSARP